MMHCAVDETKRFNAFCTGYHPLKVQDRRLIKDVHGITELRGYTAIQTLLLYDLISSTYTETPRL